MTRGSAAARLRGRCRTALADGPGAVGDERQLGGMRRRAAVFPRHPDAGDAEALQLIAIEATQEVGREARALVAIGEVQRALADVDVAAAARAVRVEVRDGVAGGDARGNSPVGSTGCSSNTTPSPTVGGSLAMRSATKSAARAASAFSSAFWRSSVRYATQESHPARAACTTIDPTIGSPLTLLTFAPTACENPLYSVRHSGRNG